MDIFYITPYSSDKHYGRELNKHIELLPNDCWVVVRDLDTMFLTSNTGDLIIQAIKDNPDASLITTNTNRIWGRVVSTNANVKDHIKRAKEMEREVKYTYMTGVVPAFCWIFPKSTWINRKFDDHPILHPKGKPMSFDARWTLGISGKKVRAEHIYIWHSYRIGGNYRIYDHLK